jgi:hypothetical protein
MGNGNPAYPAARDAAARVYPHYRAHPGGMPLLPDLEAMEAIIDVAFWTSLRREELLTPKVTLAWVEPSQVRTAVRFERPVPFVPHALTRLGPAVERPGIHLCVWRQQGELAVWGATLDIPQFCFVLEVVGPGLLVIKHSRGDDSGKFVNLAVLQGDEIKIIDQRAASAPDCPALLSSMLYFQSDVDAPETVNVLIQLAVSMREHGRGASLLVVPEGSQVWRESILEPIAYGVVPFRALANLMLEDAGERVRPRWQESLRRAVDRIAGLTAVDGATIITDRYELLAFGAKIVRRVGWKQVRCVRLTEPIVGTKAVSVEPGLLGGTRHLSAAQFVHDQRDATALIASQDGRFTVFGWSPCEDMVYANRIETLLL